MKTIKINLIRHGETMFNRLRKIQGSSNIDLSSLGVKQAQEVKLDENFDIAIHSSLNRSKDTLDIICNNLKKSPNKILNDLVIERGYGIFEGLTENEICEKYPLLYSEWKRNENIKIQDAETVEDVIERIKKFISTIIESEYKNVLVVTHSGVLFALYKFIEEIDIGFRPNNIKFANCSNNLLEIKFDENNINLKFKIGDQTEVNRCCPAEEIITNTR